MIVLHDGDGYEPTPDDLNTPVSEVTDGVFSSLPEGPTRGPRGVGRASGGGAAGRGSELVVLNTALKQDHEHDGAVLLYIPLTFDDVDLVREIGCRVLSVNSG